MPAPWRDGTTDGLCRTDWRVSFFTNATPPAGKNRLL